MALFSPWSWVIPAVNVLPELRSVSAPEIICSVLAFARLSYPLCRVLFAAVSWSDPLLSWLIPSNISGNCCSRPPNSPLRVLTPFAISFPVAASWLPLAVSASSLEVSSFAPAFNCATVACTCCIPWLNACNCCWSCSMLLFTAASCISAADSALSADALKLSAAAWSADVSGAEVVIVEVSILDALSSAAWIEPKAPLIADSTAAAVSSSILLVSILYKADSAASSWLLTAATPASTEDASTETSEESLIQDSIASAWLFIVSALSFNWPDIACALACTSEAVEALIPSRAVSSCSRPAASFSTLSMYSCTLEV